MIVSFWEGLFSGAMLVSGRVCLFGNLGRMTTKILKPPEMRFVVVHLVAMNWTHESTGMKINTKPKSVKILNQPPTNHWLNLPGQYTVGFSRLNHVFGVRVT